MTMGPPESERQLEKQSQEILRPALMGSLVSLPGYHLVLTGTKNKDGSLPSTKTHVSIIKKLYSLKENTHKILFAGFKRCI